MRRIIAPVTVAAFVAHIGSVAKLKSSAMLFVRLCLAVMLKIFAYTHIPYVL